MNRRCDKSLDGFAFTMEKMSIGKMSWHVQDIPGTVDGRDKLRRGCMERDLWDSVRAMLALLDIRVGVILNVPQTQPSRHEKKGFLKGVVLSTRTVQTTSHLEMSASRSTSLPTKAPMSHHMSLHCQRCPPSNPTQTQHIAQARQGQDTPH